ncbi:MAG: transposase family protein [Acidimicrobiia bacterium]|nr:transposase family protein [Acidimicrobiia bacterium]
MDCPEHGPTVAAVPWARHDSRFTRAFEDLVVHDAIVGDKQAAADRYGISWRAVNNACIRVAEEALGRVDLLDGLVAIAIGLPRGDHLDLCTSVDEGMGQVGGVGRHPARPGMSLPGGGIRRDEDDIRTRHRPPCARAGRSRTHRDRTSETGAAPRRCAAPRPG